MGERVDPLEGESAPRYWTVSSSARLSTVKGEGRVKKEREKEKAANGNLAIPFFFFFFLLTTFFFVGRRCRGRLRYGGSSSSEF